jgi:hypothetical protein
LRRRKALSRLPTFRSSLTTDPLCRTAFCDAIHTGPVDERQQAPTRKGSLQIRLGVCFRSPASLMLYRSEHGLAVVAPLRQREDAAPVAGLMHRRAAALAVAAWMASSCCAPTWRWSTQTSLGPTKVCGASSGRSARRRARWKCARSSIIGTTRRWATSSAAFSRCAWRSTCSAGSTSARSTWPGQISCAIARRQGVELTLDGQRYRLRTELHGSAFEAFAAAGVRP